METDTIEVIGSAANGLRGTWGGPRKVTITSKSKNATPPVGLEPTIFGLEVRRLVH